MKSFFANGIYLKAAHIDPFADSAIFLRSVLPSRNATPTRYELVSTDDRFSSSHVMLMNNVARFSCYIRRLGD